MVPWEMGYTEITYQDPLSTIFLQGYFLVAEEFFLMVVQISPGGTISNTLEIDIHI